MNDSVGGECPNTSENCLSMEQEVEFLVPISNGNLYWSRVGEVGENAERQDGDHRMLSISLLKSIQNTCFIIFVTSTAAAR